MTIGSINRQMVQTLLYPKSATRLLPRIYGSLGMGGCSSCCPLGAGWPQIIIFYHPYYPTPWYNKAPRVPSTPHGLDPVGPSTRKPHPLPELEIWEAWEELNQSSPGWEMNWDTGMGIVAMLNGNSGTIAGAPNEAAHTFLTKARKLFGLPEDLHSVVASPSETTYGAEKGIRYHEMVRSLPVFYRGMEVHLTDLGGSANVHLVQSNYVPEDAFDAVSETPTLSISDAVEKAVKDYNPGGRLQRLPPVGGAHLAYQFSVGGDTEYVVDAHNGQILYHEGFISFAHENPSGEWAQEAFASPPRLGFYIEPDQNTQEDFGPTSLAGIPRDATSQEDLLSPADKPHREGSHPLLAQRVDIVA